MTLSQFDVPYDVRDAVMKRDLDCFFTGTLSYHDNLIASWIFPPIVGDEVII